jgi:hypothetical protein
MEVAGVSDLQVETADIGGSCCLEGHSAPSVVEKGHIEWVASHWGP